MAMKRKEPKVCSCCGAWRLKGEKKIVHVAGCHAAVWDTIKNDQAKIAARRRKIEQEHLMQVLKSQKLAKKLAFGAPKNMCKGEKAVVSHWLIPGGGMETKRAKH